MIIIISIQLLSVIMLYQITWVGVSLDFMVANYKFF